ncbi:MAG: glycine hydroxymethyltransferase [Spirochaetes bacterium]|nr:glycine hydroxymethyltransferase [Spirochaetota bacterium]
MPENLIKKYLEKNPSNIDNTSFIAFLADLIEVSKVDNQIAKSIINELKDQRNNLKLIASENYCSLSTQFAMGNLLTDKYSEGFPYHRFYAGCDNVDAIEQIACDEAKKLFNAEHAYVQPHSGADANLVAYWSILTYKIQDKFLHEKSVQTLTDLSKEDWKKLKELMKNQKLLGLDYYSGGHLTHGYKYNISAFLFDAYTYSVSKDTGLLDYKQIEKQAKEIKPLILLAGYSAYPRKINFATLKQIADSVNAVLMVDMAHFAGLVAGGVFEGDFNPIPHADVVTSTTHKTLRGPRGGIVLCKKEYAETVDKGCPMILGGPLPHVLAAKAVSFKEANKSEFKAYAKKIVENANYLADALIKKDITVLTGGTDNHLMLIDVRPFNLTGRQAESAVRECGVTLNRNSIPFDPNGPWYTSGLRIGTPAVTTLGMGKKDMEEIADIMKYILSNVKAEVKNDKVSKAKYIIEDSIKNKTKERVKDLLNNYVLYPEIDMDFLLENF